MGVATVGLVYDLVRRRFGRPAGFVAGLVLALTPIAVAISRHNNPDALLILCCVAALWFVVRGLEDGRTRWLVLAGVARRPRLRGQDGGRADGRARHRRGVAVGRAARPRCAAVRQLLAGGLAMVVVGGAWPLLLALTPAADRPWVSGTSDNSIWSLISGYNGFGPARRPGRRAGRRWPAGGARRRRRRRRSAARPGWLRLLDSSMGGQAGWLLGFALVGGLAIADRVPAAARRRPHGLDPRRRRRRADQRGRVQHRQGHLPPLLRLVPGAVRGGAGRRRLRPAHRAATVERPRARARWRSPAASSTELIVLHNNPGELGWLPPVLVVVGVAAAARSPHAGGPRRAAIALAAALAVLLIAPATWAAQTLGHATNGTFPAGGPASAGFGGAGGPQRGGFGPGARSGAGRDGRCPGRPVNGRCSGRPPPAATPRRPGESAGRRLPGGFAGAARSATTPNLTQALAYVRAHGGGTLAVSSQTGASNAIIASGADVAAIGGFSGRESEVSVSWLADAVRAGKIRWVLTSGDGGLRRRRRPRRREQGHGRGRAGRPPVDLGQRPLRPPGPADALLAAAG